MVIRVCKNFYKILQCRVCRQPDNIRIKFSFYSFPISLLFSGCSFLQQLHQTDNLQTKYKDTYGNCATISHILLLEGNRLSIHCHNHRRGSRTAGSHYIDIIESFHITGYTQNNTYHNGTLDHRHNHVNSSLESGSSVQFC